ncbi:hypothetical protein F441_12760 [Phytophthora nicotianae CJ01A1]|uniref:Uncharacterized protein n=2 Tax=Phytophthora nicotianae TaxID=4792 RepID=V9EVD2_PHYNI|nr:hypothetical protein F443_12800 [Phytophthora nicotianae P1569]ETP11750.1 hypothetical protein F441_12760 [Phytophthora nicotianae CJ01A1]
MSYCMQKSPSIWTTLQITIADALLTVVSLRDIESARRGLKSLERRIDKKKGWGRFHNSAQNGRYLEQTTLDRASTLLQQNENQENTRISSTADIVRIASFCDRVLNDAKAEGEEVDTRKTVVMPKNMDPSSSLAGGMVRATGVAVHPISNDRTDIGSSNMSITLRYTCKVRRLLYMAEFLVLLNYVEVFIPLVFSLNTLATYHLPNRTYYPAFDGMDEHQLMQTLQNVMFYFLLQLFSFAMLVFTLKRMLGFSPTRQLVFVLEKQFHRVYSSVVFWVFYNVQASLQHSVSSLLG